MTVEQKKSRIGKRLLKFSAWFFGSIIALMILISSVLYFMKDDICGYVVTEVNKHLKAKVSVKDVDLAFWGTFPNLSVDFEEVFIQDAFKYATAKDTLLFTERIRLKFNPLDIWNEKYNVKKIEVAPGSLYLKVDTAGLVNYDIMQPAKDSSNSAFQLSLKEVVLEELNFSYENSLTQQSYASHINTLDLEGEFTDKQFTLASKSELFIEHISSGNIPLIQSKKAHFDMALQVDNEKGTVTFPSTVLYVENLPFRVNGSVTPSEIQFSIQADNIELKDIANHIAHQSVDQIDQFSGTGKIDFKVDLFGKRTNEEGITVNCDFGIENGSIVDPVKRLKINDIFLKGRYSNEGGAAKEFLNLFHFQFTTAGNPFSGQLKITEFANPHFRGKAKGDIDLTIANNLVHFPSVEKINGDVTVNTQFDVQSVYENGEPRYDLNRCEGEVDLHQVQLKLIDDQRTFKEVNGNLYFRNNEAGIEDISLQVGASDLAIDGVFRNVVNFLTKKESIDANVTVQSSFLNVQDLSMESKETKISADVARNWIIPNEINGSMRIDVDNMQYENHRFSNVRGTMQLNNRKINFPDIQLTNANAPVRGNLTIEEKDPEIFTIKTKVNSDQVEFKPLFKEWNNFEQAVITDDNIFGTARINLDFEAPFDLRSGIIMNAIKSKVQMRITDGRLKNVAAFKDITESMKTSPAKYILNKESIAEFEKKLLDLKFGTFENTLTIRNGKIEIPSMKIESNALDIKLEGTHDFDNNIDYRFAFRFRDLKQPKNSESEFGEVQDDGTGIILYVRMNGNMDNPNIIWDDSAKKQQAKENREKAKQDAKSILKSEFGLYKKDSTVKDFKPTSKPKEELRIEYTTDKKGSENEPKKEEKKDTKLKKTLDTWKKQSDDKKKEDIEFQ